MRKYIVLIFSIFLVSIVTKAQFPEKDLKNKTVQDPDSLHNLFLAQTTGLPINQASNITLFETFLDWRGTHYRYGGSSKSGIDCSGFATVMYKNAFNIDLAASAADIFAKQCTPVTKEQLSEGDLVFFKIGSSRISHVGVYLGDGKFAHASTRRGVIISRLEEDYYRRYFYSGGMVSVF